jgi:hypothetical protein
LFIIRGRKEARSFPKVDFVLNIGNSGEVLVNAGVKSLADWYLLIGQFILLTWSSSQKLGNMGKTSDGHFNLFSFICTYI